MSASDVQKKIAVVEKALKDAGANQAINAIIDVLKDIARTLEHLEKSTIGRA